MELISELIERWWYTTMEEMLIVSFTSETDVWICCRRIESIPWPYPFGRRPDTCYNVACLYEIIMEKILQKLDLHRDLRMPIANVNEIVRICFGFFRKLIQYIKWHLPKSILFAFN